ncbi:MAG: tetraacyldisaccharide 4'-kinase [Deltaproteobacteria bacterium]|nr:tetraacyldisaccharide 4'-kinase [Deltaproteobacteria bacterium]
MRPLSNYIYEPIPPLWFRFIMRPFSLIYELIVRIRNTLYDRQVLPTHRLDGVCISVGNLSVGGTGKSPFVIMLASRLLAKGYRPAILTRGYGGFASEPVSLVLLGGKLLSGSAAHIADEAMMQSQMLPLVPVIVGKDRVRGARNFLESQTYRPTHWILDDGFQHRRIERDVDIVLFDAESCEAGHSLLPVGPLREPTSSVRRADILCFTRAGGSYPTDQAQTLLRRFNASAPQILIRFHTQLTTSLSGESFSKDLEPVLLMCGIARPESLKQTLQDQGIKLGCTYFVADHGNFKKEIIRKKLQGCRAVVTSAKDYWRNPSIFEKLPLSVFIAGLDLKISESDEELLFEQVSHPKNFRIKAKFATT